MTGPTAARLPGGRLHFQHGPIDLILEAVGPESEVAAAYRQAWADFRPVLDDLVAVLPLLRTPVADLPPYLLDPLAGTAGATADRPRQATQQPSSPRRRGSHGDAALASAFSGTTQAVVTPAPAAGRDCARPIATAPAAASPPARPGAAGPFHAGEEEAEAGRSHPAGFARPGRAEVMPLTPTEATPSSPRGATCPLALGGETKPAPAYRAGAPRPPGIDPASPAAAMLAAAARHAPAFVTPMAAVAGAVADHVLAAMVAGRRLDRAWVNNGGDAALWLPPGAEVTAAGGPALADRIRVTADSPVRGIATSGWRGRSHSLGIADAVTVLARTAAEADVAATLIANAVDLPGHPTITRRPARELAPDSDLGRRLVTTGVGPLSPDERAQALAAGRASAGAMRRAGLIEAAALWLAGDCVTAGALDPAPGDRTAPR